MIQGEGAGKGDKPRDNFDYSKYWDNFENISSNGKKSPKKVIQLKGGKKRYIY